MINRASLDLIREFEGFRAEAYKDPVGIWTIGYGTTAAAGVGITPRAGMKITEAQADGYLDAAVTKFAHQVTEKITRPINDNQFGAFVSLAYNIGPGAFGKSTALRRFNAGDVAGAAEAILFFNKAGGKVLRGLERRRLAERALFLNLAVDPVASKPVAVSKTPKVSDKPTLHPAPARLHWLAVLFSAIMAIFRRWK